MKHTVKFKVIELNDGRGFFPVISLMINGKPAKMIIDTGASITVMSLKNIGKYIKPSDVKTCDSEIISIANKEKIGGKYSYVNLSIANAIISGVVVNILDLGSFEEIFSSNQINIQGVLGMNFFYNTNAIVDFKNKKITFYSK